MRLWGGLLFPASAHRSLMTWEAQENSQRLIIKTFAQLETESQGITLLRVLRVRACRADFQPQVDDNFEPAVARTATPTRCTGMTGFSNKARWAALGHAPEDCRTARVSGCLASRSEPARTTKHPTPALTEQPKITLSPLKRNTSSERTSPRHRRRWHRFRWVWSCRSRVRALG